MKLITLKAHPRSRVENALNPTTSNRRLGSSPLTRGKHSYPATWDYCQGIIPACAGKTFEVGRDYTHYPAHPRVSGENPSKASA